MSEVFEKVYNRREMGSLKWDVDEDVIPLWVADMDFQTAPPILEAIEKRASQGIFGYSIITEDWYMTVQKWWHERHHLTIEQDWLIFATGVVPILTTAVNRLTNVGDNVLIQTPVYNIFFNSIVNSGRHLLESPLVYDGIDYEIDFEALEEDLAKPLTTLMILCNPHNPIGKIWSKETLARIGALCHQHHVTLLSDEIHCDITQPGESYIPFASVNETCREISVTACSATKTFNLAGLQTAIAIVPNPRLFAIMERGLNSGELAEPNAFAIPATVAAFTAGGPWLEALNNQIQKHKEWVTHFLNKEVPQVKVTPSKATYLMWLDVSAIELDASKLHAYLLDQHKVLVSDGKQFGGNGKHFLRLNVACPGETLKEGLNRLAKGLKAYKATE